MTSLSGTNGGFGLTRQAGILFALSAAVLGTAYASQHLGGLEPCQLCPYQRWPWWIALGLAAAALVPALPASARRVLLVLTGLVLLAGAVLGFYHAGVEYKWWAGPSTCGGGWTSCPRHGSARASSSTLEIRANLGSGPREQRSPAARASRTPRFPRDT